MKLMRVALFSALLLAGGMVLAEEEAPGDAIHEALKSRSGKAATVMLSSGKELTGKVDDVTEDSVRLRELSGKEFFDAVIDLNRIEAVIFRVRDR